MRKFCLILSLCLSSLIYAQDVIVLNDGSSIISKVVEVGSTDVKYKRWSNLEGPTYTLKITEILSVNYQNGEKESFSERSQQIQEEELSSLMSSNQIKTEINSANRLEKEKLLASARNLNIIANVVTWGGLISSIVGGILVEEGSTWIIVGGILGTIATSAIIETFASNYESAANAINTTSIYQYDIELGNSVLSPSINLMSDNNAHQKVFGIGVKYSF